MNESPTTIEKPMDSLTIFDQLVPQLMASFSSFQTVGHIHDLKRYMEQLKEQTMKEDFSLVISQRPRQVLHLLMEIYRNNSTGLRFLTFPSKLRESITPCLKNDELMKKSTFRVEFAAACLEFELESPDDAFPLMCILSFVQLAMVKRISKMKFWLSVSTGGQLLLFHRTLNCIGLMLPELCTPIVVSKMDLYTYLLRNMCSIIPQLSDLEMKACRSCLSLHLNSDRPLVALFASDVLKFIARFAPPGFTMHLVLDAFRALINATPSEIGIARITCIRLFSELSPAEKVELLERLPVRRHFFLWSQLPASSFSDLDPEVVDELYAESMAIINEAVYNNSSNDTAIMRSLCRLPLALECLCSIIRELNPQRKTVTDAKMKLTNVTKLFMPLWNLLTSVENIVHLPVVKICLAHVLRLCSLIHNELRDADIVRIFEFFCRPDIQEDALFLICGAQFAKSLAFHRKSQEIIDLAIRFFSSSGTFLNPLVKNVVVQSFIWFAARLKCDTMSKGCVEEKRQLSKMVEVYFSNKNSVTPTAVWTDLQLQYLSQQYMFSKDNQAIPVFVESNGDVKMVENGACLGSNHAEVLAVKIDCD